jgi:tetratricopeptide (TPR) repeat protein
LTGDALVDAHTLATTGHRADALETLATYLKAHPTDSDARIYYGIVLSWEDRYDDARRELNTVLAKSPMNSDALGALINLEMWADRPAEAEALTRRALAQRVYAKSRPRAANVQNVSFLVSRARALNALNRTVDAREVVKEALAIEPGNEAALRLKNSLDEQNRHWKFGQSYGSDWFSDGRTPWRETSTSLSRAETPAGAVIARFSHAEGFSSTDNQFEVEAYPGIRKGTYAYVSVGVSPVPPRAPRSLQGSRCPWCSRW